MEHREWVGTKTPPHSEACFTLELGLGCEQFKLTAGTCHEWDWHSYSSPAIPNMERSADGTSLPTVNSAVTYLEHGGAR